MIQKCYSPDIRNILSHFVTFRFPNRGHYNTSKTTAAVTKSSRKAGRVICLSFFSRIDCEHDEHDTRHHFHRLRYLARPGLIAGDCAATSGQILYILLLIPHKLIACAVPQLNGEQWCHERQ